MKKKNKFNWKIILIGIIVVIIIIAGLNFINKYELFNDNFKEDLSFEETEEKKELSSNLEDIRSGLSIITVLTCIDKYNAGGDYVTKKNKNLLETNTSKQIFVMEEILKNEENNKNFILLDNEGKELKTSNYPTEEGIYAYYPYNLFIEEYQKYFNDSFDIETRDKSSTDNKYDTNKEYIYYNNRRAGLNGLMIENIDISSVSKNSNNEYQANIVLNYSKRLKEMLEADSEQATINYVKDNNKIKIISYEIN